MSQKQIALLVALLFALVTLGALLNMRREAEISARLAQLSPEELVDVRFYKDPLRDSEGLDLAVEQPADLDALAAALRTLSASSVSLKTLELRAEFKLLVTLEPEDELLVSVLRAQQTGEVGVVSIVRKLGAGEVPGGTFESPELLAWVEAMQRRPEFASIAEHP